MKICSNPVEASFKNPLTGLHKPPSHTIASHFRPRCIFLDSLGIAAAQRLASMALTGKVVVFTGAMSMKRAEATKLAVGAGASVVRASQTERGLRGSAEDLKLVRKCYTTFFRKT